ncbi:MAG TPA: AAA family ATPase [Verrucomicrobiae bacterium]|nr:AAA family ATPase [Verrucomicrobiae bacterium]
MIILFCGIPGSGKTTISDILAARLAKIGRVKVLSSDRLRPPVYRRIFNTLESDRGKEDFLILDATFYKKEWRERVEALARDERVLTVHLECRREAALKRNQQRRPKISDRALHIVYHRMERPERPGIAIDTETTGAEAAAERIFDRVTSFEPRPEQHP